MLVKSETKIEELAPTSLAEANLKPRGKVHPSPCDWRDQVLYFLLPDRFADGMEDQRPRYDRSRPEQFRAHDSRQWQESGRTWQGGTIKGIASKLDYLQNLGITALWVGPVWRQRRRDQEPHSYHGYGIQNFLDVDPSFGSRQDLRDLVDAAHGRGMYVILDIIFNHTGNNWFYKHPATGEPVYGLPYRDNPPYEFHGWRSVDGRSLTSSAELAADDGVWPKELQNPNLYHRRGVIDQWDPKDTQHPMDPTLVFRRGDFTGDLKDLDHEHSPALAYMITIYKYWIALSDCDGFRIDTVKHMSDEATRTFCREIREFAESIGKENFWLIGEVAGPDNMRVDYLDVFGQNLSAVLDIGEAPKRLASLARGETGVSSAFFKQFVANQHETFRNYREAGRYHVSILDDHDMIWLGIDHQARFAAGCDEAIRYQQVAHAVGVQLTTLGLPCIYYGTEQAFDGSCEDGAAQPAGEGYFDRYVRETMFGATFGAFGTSGCHFFDPTHPTYRRIAAIARLRARRDLVGMALRRGRQYQRPTFLADEHIDLPLGQSGELVAWSRILDKQEVLVVLNTYPAAVREAEVAVDSRLHPVGSCLTYLYRGDWSDAELVSPPSNHAAAVTCRPDGLAVIHIDLPPAGMAILA